MSKKNKTIKVKLALLETLLLMSKNLEAFEELGDNVQNKIDQIKNKVDNLISHINNVREKCKG